MKTRTLLHAALAAALTLGMTSLGAAAAFADDIPSAPAATSSPTPDPAPPAAPAADPAPAPAPATDPPATDPASAPPASADPAPVDTPDATPPAEATAPQPAPGPATATSPVKPNSRTTARSAVDPTPYVLLAWYLPCGVADPWCAPGQNLVYHLDLATPSLDALDAQLANTCNDWQVDLENDSPTTTALIAGGVLYAPNDPAEDHAYGAVPGNPWKYVDNPGCAAPAASATDQRCVRNTVLQEGSIQVVITPHVTYTITGPSGTVPFDATTGLTGTLPPGAYSVSFVLDPGWTTSLPSPIPLTIAAYTGPCNTSVTPAAVAVGQGCKGGVTLTDGHITVSILAGVTYTITGPGGAVAYDAVSGETADLPPGNYSVAYSLAAGYVSGVTSPIPLVINPYGAACAPTPVTPAASAAPQTCVQGVFLTGGKVTVTITPGVHYTITGASGVVAFDPLTGETGPVDPGPYTVTFTLDPTYSTAVANPIMVFVNFYDGPCDLTTDPLVVPLVSFTPPSCTSAGSYTLANDLGVVGAVKWTVNGTPGATNGTYPAARNSTVTIDAAPNSPGFGFGAGQQTHWSHTFTFAGTACAETLAFTGSSLQGIGWVAVILVISGLLILRVRAMVRRRVS